MSISSYDENLLKTPEERAAEQAEASENAEAQVSYLKTIMPEKRSHRGRNITLIIIAVVLLFALGGAGAYWKFGRTPSHSNTQQTTTKPPSTTQSQSTETPATTTTSTKHYSANTFSIEFNYPADWTVAEANNQLTATSPAVSLTDATGQATPARIVMTIQNKQASLPAFKDGNAVAVLDSDKVKYTKPTPTQRGETYISYLQYFATNVKGGMDGIYVTGNNGYQYKQTVPQSDVTGIDPLITVTFLKCTDQNCTASATPLGPLTITSTTWKASQLGKDVTAMLQSLQIE